MLSKTFAFLTVFSLFTGTAFPYSAKVIRYTTNGTSSGTSVEPGFSFNTIWTGLGMGKNHHVYVAVCDQWQTFNDCGGTTPKKGNVCIVKYDPYTNTLKSCGTVKRAAQGAGNWMSNESQEKIHTHLQSTPDGKLWMATHDNAEVDSMPSDPCYYNGIFYRGGHLLYVDVNNGDTLVDHSPTMKYYFKKDDVVPRLMTHNIAPSDTSGVTFQYHSIMILALNPWAPRYLWMEAAPGAQHQLKIVVYDRIADTMRTVGVGESSQREIVVDRQGRGYYINSGNALRKTPDGQTAIIGKNLTLGHSTTYSRTYDSAFTITGGSGELNLYDFVNDTVKQIAKLPGGGNSFRSLYTSRDGKKLYTIATSSGNVYEINIATGAYTNIYNVSSQLSGYWYATGNMCVDTLGNIYSGLHNGQANNAALLQVNLGKDLVWPLDIPNATAVEKAAIIRDMDGNIKIAPNPVHTGALVSVSRKMTGQDITLAVYDAVGKRVGLLHRGKSTVGIPLSVPWNTSLLPSGIYYVRLTTGNKTTVKSALVIR